MGKGKRIEAELQLPEAIIQHIQSFLNGKEAAQTKILSKSWYDAWLTRPNLDFDQHYFVRNFYRRDFNRFWEFVEETVQRYENLNLKVDSLRLWMYDTYRDNAVYCSHSLANELITEAIKMGASDLDFKIDYQDKAFALPHEVLGSENIIRLYVSGCKIDLGKVACFGLESLSLDNMWLEGDIIWRIISRCPLIEKLSLSNCSLFETQRHTSRVVSVASTSRLVLSPFVHEFRKLKCLFLSCIDVHTLFFNDLSSKFPCLKDLAIHNCGGYKRIQISSPSLECINFTQEKMLRAKFDVPRLRKFTFKGSDIPLLSFKTTRSNWESDISIKRCSPPSVTWFLELTRSKVYLTLIDCVEIFKVCLNLKWKI